MAFGLSILLFIVSLFAIIMIHEGGHYLAARKFNFRVLEYFLGFGPRLWSFRRGEVEYGVKAIPAGGYVKIAGMNPFEDDVPPGDEARAYSAKPTWQRVTVILCGPFSHFLVAWLIFSLVFAFAMNPNIPSVVGVDYLIDGAPSPAAIAGVKNGDVIMQIGDLDKPTRAQIGAYQLAHVGQPITYVLDRNGEPVTITMTPVETTTDDQTSARIGIQMSGVREGPLAAFAHGGGAVWDTTRESVVGLGTVFGPAGIKQMLTLLFTDEQRKADGTSAVSLVGVGQMAGHAGSEGAWAWYFMMFATVVLFLGLINLLPFPPLDGGHVAIALIEKVRHKRIDMKKVVPVSVVVLVFLGFFSISAMILDIAKPLQTGP